MGATMTRLYNGATVRKCRICLQMAVILWGARCGACIDAGRACLPGRGHRHEWCDIPLHPRRGGWTRQCTHCGQKAR